MTDLSHEARELLALTRRVDGPNDGNRRRVTAALSASLGISVAGTASAAAAGSASAVASGVAAKVVIAALIGAGAGIAVTVPAAMFVDRAERPAPSSAVAGPAPSAPRHAGPVPVSNRSFPPEAKREPESPAVSEPSLAKSSAHASGVPSVGTPELAREAELLAGAQAELGKGRPQRALDLLNEHERRHPAGALAQERAAAMVIALCGAGQTEQARARAQEFLKRAPDSVLVPRIMSSCVFKKAPPSASASFPVVTDPSAAGHSRDRR